MDIIEHVRLRSCPHPNGSRFDQPIKAAAVPRSQWPLAARAIAKLARAQDRGVGDTIARIIDPMGGKLYKRWHKRLMGRPCGCNDEQARLNAIYPYTPVDMGLDTR
jgi:hypothetical protein